jgi:hypothetical protein
MITHSIRPLEIYNTYTEITHDVTYVATACLSRGNYIRKRQLWRVLNTREF